MHHTRESDEGVKAAVFASVVFSSCTCLRIVLPAGLCSTFWVVRKEVRKSKAFVCSIHKGAGSTPRPAPTTRKGVPHLAVHCEHAL